MLITAIVWLAPLTAGAEALTIGGPGDPGGFCAPFGCNLGVGTRFQQVYSASGLIAAAPTPITTPISISQIDFFHASGQPFGHMTSGNYEIRLSTTGVAVDELETTFDNNVGGDEQTFKTFSLADGLATSATFELLADAPFLYDPTNGNLLVDIFADSPASVFAFEFFESRNGTAGGLFSIVQDFGSGQSDGFGLVTQLHYTIIPEPSSFLLVGMGILAIGVRSRRR